MTPQPQHPGSVHTSRRGLLLGAVALVALSAERRALASDFAADMNAARSLSFEHTHTGERLSVTYFQAGSYVASALSQVNVLLRDFRTESVHDIDPALLDVLHALQRRTGGGEAFQIISGYRSPGTNAMLHERSYGVAEHSLHMEGRAIDVRLPGHATSRVAVLARQLQFGGVGYYRFSNFVHVDTGRVRLWGDPVHA